MPLTKEAADAGRIPILEAEPFPRLYLDVDQDHPDGPRLALFDQAGRLLPAQIAGEWSHVEGEPMTFAVRFLVDHDYVRFANAGGVSVRMGAPLSEELHPPAGDAPASVSWDIARKHLPEKFRNLMGGETYRLQAGPKPEDARREFEERFSLPQGSLGNTPVTRAKPNG